MSEKVITNPAAQEKDGVLIKIFKHGVSSRIMHGCVAVGFTIACVSGFLLFFGVPIPRDVTALLHCCAGLLIIVPPLIYIVTNWNRFARFMGTITSYDKDDKGWITAPMGGYLDPYLWRGQPEHYVPPQDKYNTGQKLAGICLVLGALGLAITGILMWANTPEGIFGAIHVEMNTGMTTFIWTLHLVAAILTGLVFLVHVFLGAIYYVTRVEFGTMFGNGIADYAYTKKKHGKWIETLEVMSEREMEDSPEYEAYLAEKAKKAAEHAAEHEAELAEMREIAAQESAAATEPNRKAIESINARIKERAEAAQ